MEMAVQLIVEYKRSILVMEDRLIVQIFAPSTFLLKLYSTWQEQLIFTEKLLRIFDQTIYQAIWLILQRLVPNYAKKYSKQVHQDITHILQ